MRGAGEGDAGAGAAGDPKPPVLPIETTTVLPQEKVKSFRSGGPKLPGPTDQDILNTIYNRDRRIRMYRTITAGGPGGPGFRSGGGEGDAGAGAPGVPTDPKAAPAGDPSSAGTGIELPDDAVQPDSDDSDDEVAPVLPIETTTVLPQEKVKSFRSGGRDPRIRMYRTIHARGFRSGKDSGMMNKLMESIMDQLEKGEPIKMVVDVKPQ